MGYNTNSMAWMINLFFLTVASSDIPPKSLDCPSQNWFLDSINYRCLLVVSSPMTYYSAAASCKVLGTQMASISTCDDTSLIQDIVNYSLNITIPVTLWSKYHLVNEGGDSYFIADESDRVMPGSEIKGKVESTGSNLCVQSALDPPTVHRLQSDCQEKHHFLCEYRLPSPVSGMIMVTPTGMAIMVLAMVVMFALVIFVSLELIVELRRKHAAAASLTSEEEKPIAYENNIVFQTEKMDLSSRPKSDIISVSEDNIFSTEKQKTSLDLLPWSKDNHTSMV